MTALSPRQLAALVDAVQHNADVSDARHAGGYPLCVYLMKLRDFYRWWKGVGFNDPLDREALGKWIPAMEEHWERLDENAGEPVDLPLPCGPLDCFDCTAINAVLNPLGYAYAAGYGRAGAPVFFLARLKHSEAVDNPEEPGKGGAPLRLIVSGEELARSLDAPPAMSAPGWIFVRRDALARYLAGMVEEWNWKREDNAMGRVVSYYGFDRDPEAALEKLLETEQENVILHEIGERIAGALIGDGWQSMLRRTDDPLTELKIRAVRDILADCLASLPACVTLENWPSLDFYYANMTPLRRELFPGFCNAYRAARASGHYRSLAPVIASAREHWLAVSRQLPRCAPDALDGLLGRCAF